MIRFGIKLARSIMNSASMGSHLVGAKEGMVKSIAKEETFVKNKNNGGTMLRMSDGGGTGANRNILEGFVGC